MTTTCETPGKHRANMVTRRAGAEPAQVARRLRDVVSRAEQRQPGLQQPPVRRNALRRAGAQRCPALDPCLREVRFRHGERERWRDGIAQGDFVPRVSAVRSWSRRNRGSATNIWETPLRRRDISCADTCRSTPAIRT